MFVDPVMSGASVIRVVLVQLDTQAGDLSFSGVGRAQVALPDLRTVTQRLNDREDDTDLEFEILRLRACFETCSNALTRVNRGVCGAHLPRGVIRQLDKHGLDVALSAGRHAAERAKLAGVGRLIAVAPSVCPAAERRPLSTGSVARYSAHELPGLDRCLPQSPACSDHYDALLCRGRPEIAALVGVAIAAAQMGIPFCLPDPAGGIAVDAAVGLNPGVLSWLDSIPVRRPRSVPSPAYPRSLCAV